MNRLDNAAKLKEEKLLFKEPIKLHKEEDGHLTSPSIKHKVRTPVSHSHEDTTFKVLPYGPKTPNPNHIDPPCDADADAETSTDCISSPLSSVDCCESPTNDNLLSAEVDTSDNSDPKTPKGMFDPFAPGPDSLEIAPICSKVLKIPGKFTPRRLKFDDFGECLESRKQNLEDCGIETVYEEMVLESLYTAVLETVVQSAIEDFLAKSPKTDTSPFKTPPGRKLTGIADDCPAAPMKTAASKSSNIGVIRRKLEF